MTNIFNFQDRQLTDGSQRIALVLKLTMQAVLLLAYGHALFHQHWIHAALICATIWATVLPRQIRKRYSLTLPPDLEIVVVGFVFATLFLGEIGDFYNLFWWWDVALHTAAGFFLGLVGFFMIFSLSRGVNLQNKFSPAFISLFAFVFSVALAGVWEIFEFGMDQCFGLNMQKSGLVDTMEDLIVATLGSGAVALWGFAYLRYGRASFVSDWINQFISRNPVLVGLASGKA